MPACLQILESAAHLKTVLLWQNDIQDDTLRAFFEDFFNRFLAIDGGYNFKAAIAQWRHHHCQFCPAIIHDEYLLPRHPIITFLNMLHQRMEDKGYSLIISPYGNRHVEEECECPSGPIAQPWAHSHAFLTHGHTLLPVDKMLFHGAHQFARIKRLCQVFG